MRDANGRIYDFKPERLTLVVTVKTNCDGCRDFYRGDFQFSDLVDVLVVAASVQGEADFAGSSREVFAAPELLEVLEVKWPPFYVLIAPGPSRVIGEGVAFGAAQVAQEIAALLD